jgi:myo-inositol-1(or 4)-monophosphatase
MKKSKSEFSWTIDPIDGTRSFIIGSPTWSNLISVNFKNDPTFALVNFPAMKKYYITGTNNTSYLVENNKFKKLKVTKTKSLNNSKIAGNFFGWLSINRQSKIAKLTKLMRYPCSDALSYCQLCEGKLNAVLQCSNKIWDIHPMISLIKNAGGYISTWKGKDPRVGGDIIASSSRMLHKKILNMLKPVA